MIVLLRLKEIALILCVFGCSTDAPLPEIDDKTKAKAMAARKYHSKATDAETNQFLDKMKQAIQNKDMAAVAKCLCYPCRLNENKEHILIKDEAQFLEHAERIVPKIKNLVLKVRIDDLFVNSAGFMIGNGEIWFDPLKGIITFNVN